MRLWFLTVFLLLTCSFSARLCLLGQLSMSDFSVEQNYPAEFDFNDSRNSVTCLFQGEWDSGKDINVGIELGVLRFSSFSWESHTESYTRLRESYGYSAGVFICKGWECGAARPFIKLSPGLHSTSCYSGNFTNGYPGVEGTNSAGFHFGLGCFAGIDVKLGENWGTRVEGGRTFLRREEFPFFQVSEVNRLDSWNLRLGVFLDPDW